MNDLNRFQYVPEKRYLKYNSTDTNPKYIDPGEYIILPVWVWNQINKGVQAEIRSQERIIFAKDPENLQTTILIPASYHALKTVPVLTPVPPIPKPNQIYTWDGARNWQNKLFSVFKEAKDRGQGLSVGCVAPLGAGKTRGGLFISWLFPNRTLVVCPTYLRSTWIDEAQRIGASIPVFSTYESLKKKDPKDFDLVIFDEVLALKNPEAKRTQEARAFTSTGTKYVLGLTGTPSSISSYDWCWINALNKYDALPENNYLFEGAFALGHKDIPASEKKFRKAGAKGEVIAWNLKKILNYLEGFAMVIDKKEIESELPEISQRVITLPQPANFNMVKSGAYTNSSAMKVLSQVRCLSSGFVYKDESDAEPVIFDTRKAEEIYRIYEETGEPLVVFSAFTQAIKNVEKLLTDKGVPVSVLCGDTLDQGKEIEDFKEGRTEVLIANIGMSSGMNLQERSRILIIESNNLKPVDRQQAIGRVYRPGQKRAVQVIDLVCEKTLDEKQVMILNQYSNASQAFIEEMLLKELMIL